MEHTFQIIGLKQFTIKSFHNKSPNLVIAIMTEPNIAALGDWDHGVEPSVLDATRIETSAFLLDAQEFLSTALHDLTASLSKVRESLWKDEAFNEHMANHTEEEVAGMKLCVSKTVHQESFVAPC